MTVTCPEGHRSESTDYCDICGTPIEAGPGAAGATGSGPTGGAGSGTPGPVIPPAADGSALDLDPSPAPTLTCPHCGAPNVADALFCEACGYDFTTGAAPLDSAPVVPDEGQLESALDLDADVDAAQEDPSGEDLAVQLDTGSAAVPEDEGGDDSPAGPEEDAGSGPVGQADAAPEAESDTDAGAEAGRSQQEQKSEASPAPEPEAVPAADVAPEAPAPATPDRAAVAAHVRPRHTPPSRALSDTWVVEVWVDPDWYAVQQTEEACPSPGLPDIVVVRRNVVLIGRPSGSLGVRPDVDAGADSAVSRRHAQLTSDGSRWWIEDLGSSNGTYVGSVGEPLPTEPIRQRVEIDRDDRIYLGAWTRLVLRQATASEQAGQG